MPIYETVFIARQDLSEAHVKDLSKKYQDVLTANKGKILKEENWGLRTLAYRMNKNRKGYYVLIEADTTSEAVIEMKRLMGIDEDIIRSQILKLEEPSKEPSPTINSRDDSSRDSSSRDRPSRDDNSDNNTKDSKEAA